MTRQNETLMISGGILPNKKEVVVDTGEEKRQWNQCRHFALMRNTAWTLKDWWSAAHL